MRYRTIALAGLLVISGCSSGAKQRAAEEKRKQDDVDAKIEKRAKEIATEMAQKVEQDEENKRHLAAEGAVEAQKALKQKLVQNPDAFFDASGLQVQGTGGPKSTRHVIGLSLTNKAQFSVSDIRGAVDFYDENLEVIATIPVNLSGAIAPLSSMVFSEQQHNLSAGTVQVSAVPAGTKFKVTSVKLVEVADPGAVPDH